MDFAGKSVLVTGASRGIGAAIARAFATEGAYVTVNYLQNTNAANKSVADCQASGGDAIAVKADVTDLNQAFLLVEKAVEAFGKVDVLVNNAFRPYRFDPEQRKLHWELDWSDYQLQFEGAVKSAHSLAQAVLPSMLKEAGFGRRRRWRLRKCCLNSERRRQITHFAVRKARTATNVV